MNKKNINSRPGTVSKILWHFTGGPKWDNINKCQLDKLKSPYTAYKNLCGILKTNSLKVGNYREKIETYINSLVKLPVKDSKMKQVAVRGEIPLIIESNPVCCVSDIPINHLQYHANRYGKFAIGFSRDILIDHKFNPVFYTLKSGIISGHLISVIKKVSTITNSIEALNLNMDEFYDLIKSMSQEIKFDFEEHVNALRKIMNIIKQSSTSSFESLSYFASYYKTLNAYDEVYNEREWRSLFTYKFKYNDIKFIILPRNGRKNYFKYFLENDIKKFDISRSIPIIPWEDLIEY